MNFWHQAPFARLLMPLIAGILCSIFFEPPALWIFAGSGFFFLAYLLLFFLTPKDFSKRHQLIRGYVLFGLFFGLGLLLHDQYDQRHDPRHFSYYPSSLKSVQISEAPVLKAKSVKIIARVKAVNSNNEWKHSIGKLLLYFERDSLSEQLRYGDQLLVKLREKEVPAPGNPGEFNYKRYLQFNNIFHQGYLKHGSYMLTARAQGNAIFALACNSRSKLVTLFKEYIPQAKEAAVATALVFGYADELDPELVQSYSNTGTLHVLAVSGMHVGIIYLVLNYLLGFMDRSRRTLALKALLIGIFLWAYSMIAGLSPSILRAATMFSFLTLGQMINRKSSIYNTLAASVFVLVIVKPTIIANVGFQLSYAAVSGIVFLYPYLYRLFLFRNRMADLCWQMTAVSLAAQLTTFPIGLLYFHQFPNYFLFSNMIIIPLTTVMLYVGIVFISLSWQPLIASLIAKLMFYGIRLTNFLVEQIDRLPYATLNGISISMTETIMLYASLAFATAFLFLRKAWQLRLSLCLALCLLTYNLFERSAQLRQRLIIVYHVKGHSAIGLFNGTEASLLTDSLLIQDAAALRFHIRQHWWDMGLGDIRQQASPLQAHPCILSNGKKNVLMISGRNKIPAQTGMRIHYILLSNNPRLKLEELQQKFHPEQLIFDSSNKPKKIKFLKARAAALNMAFHDVAEKGAFEIRD